MFAVLIAICLCKCKCKVCLPYVCSVFVVFVTLNYDNYGRPCSACLAS